MDAVVEHERNLDEMTELMIREYKQTLIDTKATIVAKLMTLYPIIYVVHVETTSCYGKAPYRPIGVFSSESRAKKEICSGYREFYSAPDGGESSNFKVIHTPSTTFKDTEMLIDINKSIDMDYYGSPK